MTNLSTDRNLWMMFFSVDGRTEIDRLAMKFVVHLPGLSLACGERVLAIATQRKTESFGQKTIGIYRDTFPERKESIFKEIIFLCFLYFFPLFLVMDLCVRESFVCCRERS